MRQSRARAARVDWSGARRLGAVSRTLAVPAFESMGLMWPFVVFQGGLRGFGVYFNHQLESDHPNVVLGRRQKVKGTST